MPDKRGCFCIKGTSINDAEKGGNVMKAFDHTEFESYKAEAQSRWGKTDAYKEHAEKTKTYDKQKWNSLAADMDAIMGEFACCMKTGCAVDGKEAQRLVKKLQSHITENYYACTNEILFGLGQMYTADERFKNNIDKHAEGPAEFVSRSITCYCNKD